MQLRFLLLLPCVALPACLNWLDVGGDGESSDSSPTTPAAGDSNAFGAAEALSTYCAARHTYEDGCPGSDGECEKAMTDNCEATFSAYRPAYIAARAKCGMPAACTFYYTDSDMCVQEESGKTEPSAVAVDLATTLCTMCPNRAGATTSCLDGLFDRSKLVGNAYTAAGQGVEFVDLSDANLQKVRDACLDEATKYGAAYCWSEWGSCLQEQLPKLKPDAVRVACTPSDVAIPIDPGGAGGGIVDASAGD